MLKILRRSQAKERFSIHIESSGNGGIFAWDEVKRERLFFATNDELIAWLREKFPASPEHGD